MILTYFYYAKQQTYVTPREHYVPEILNNKKRQREKAVKRVVINPQKGRDRCPGNNIPKWQVTPEVQEAPSPTKVDTQEGV